MSGSATRLKSSQTKRGWPGGIVAHSSLDQFFQTPRLLLTRVFVVYLFGEKRVYSAQTTSVNRGQAGNFVEMVSCIQE